MLEWLQDNAGVVTIWMTTASVILWFFKTWDRIKLGRLKDAEYEREREWLGQVHQDEFEQQLAQLPNLGRSSRRLLETSEEIALTRYQAHILDEMRRDNAQGIIEVPTTVLLPPPRHTLASRPPIRNRHVRDHLFAHWNCTRCHGDIDLAPPHEPENEERPIDDSGR